MTRGIAATIRRVAGQCLKRVPLDKRLRLLGVRVGNLLSTEEFAAQASGAHPALAGKLLASVDPTEQLF